MIRSIPARIIESNELAELNLELTNRNVGMLTINGHIEVFDFSVNSTSSEGEETCKLESLHTENTHMQSRKRSSSFSNSFIRRPQRRRSSSLGDLDDASSKRTLANLVASMAEIFPDYSFDCMKPQQFMFQDLSSVILTANNYLAEINEENPAFLTKLWKSIDFTVDMNRCDIFEFKPRFGDDDPFSDGCLWSLNYFFLNRDSCRLAYFTCAAVSNLHRINCQEDACDDSDCEEDNMDESPRISDKYEDNDEDEMGSELPDNSDDDDSPDW